MWVMLNIGIWGYIETLTSIGCLCWMKDMLLISPGGCSMFSHLARSSLFCHLSSLRIPPVSLIVAPLPADGETCVFVWWNKAPLTGTIRAVKNKEFWECCPGIKCTYMYYTYGNVHNTLLKNANRATGHTCTNYPKLILVPKYHYLCTHVVALEFTVYSSHR